MKILILIASLKHAPEISNTEELANLVVGAMRKEATIEAEAVRLADKNIPVGLGYRESDDDEWPSIVDRILDADIVIFATPVWWGQRSSLMQRVIERMDSFDEGAVPGGRAALLNKVAGIVVTGSEDGAQQTGASIMEVLTFMNFTLPPQAIAYWVGEVGEDPKTERDRRRKSKAAATMAENLGKNLMYYARLLKERPMPKE